MDVEAWYVARTKMHREVATAHVLAQRGLDVYLPLLPPSSRPRARTVVREPLFPGYLFARLDVYSNTWLSARSAPGVVYFLGGDEAPTAVPDELIEEIRARAEGGSFAQRRPKFVPGQTVVIRHGPFSGLAAIFDSNQSGRGRVRVLLEIVQRLVPVDLHVDEIASVTPESAAV